MSTRKRKLQVVAATQRRKMLCSSRRGKFIVFVYRMQFLFYFRYNFFLILDINYNTSTE